MLDFDDFDLGGFGMIFGGIAGIILLVIILCFVVPAMAKKHDRLVDECMADGLKEYECEAKFK